MASRLSVGIADYRGDRLGTLIFVDLHFFQRGCDALVLFSVELSTQRRILGGKGYHSITT